MGQLFLEKVSIKLAIFSCDIDSTGEGDDKRVPKLAFLLDAHSP